MDSVMEDFLNDDLIMDALNGKVLEEKEEGEQSQTTCHSGSADGLYDGVDGDTDCLNIQEDYPGLGMDTDLLDDVLIRIIGDSEDLSSPNLDRAKGSVQAVGVDTEFMEQSEKVDDGTGRSGKPSKKIPDAYTDDLSLDFSTSCSQNKSSKSSLLGDAPGGRELNLKSRRHGVYIGNLTWWTSEEMVKETFSMVGIIDIKEMKMFDCRMNGQFKGYCLVLFESENSVAVAFEKMALTSINGQHPVVKPDSRQSLLLLDSEAKTRPPPSCCHMTANSNNGPCGNGHDKADPSNGVGRGLRPLNGNGGIGGPRNQFPRGGGSISGQNRFGGPRQPNGNGLHCAPSFQPPDFGQGHDQMMRNHQRFPRPPFPIDLPPPGQGHMHNNNHYDGGWGAPGPHYQHPPPFGGHGPPHHIRPPICMPPPHVNPAFLGSLFPPGHQQQQHNSCNISSHGDNSMHNVCNIPPHGPGAPNFSPPPAAAMLKSCPAPEENDWERVDCSDEEMEKLLSRNSSVSSAAIRRAVEDAAGGEFASAIETLVTAISIIRSSKISREKRCKVLTDSLQDTLEGIEERSYGRKTGNDNCLTKSRKDLVLRDRLNYSRSSPPLTRRRSRSREHQDYYSSSREREYHRGRSSLSSLRTRDSDENYREEGTRRRSFDDRESKEQSLRPSSSKDSLREYEKSTKTMRYDL